MNLPVLQQPRFGWLPDIKYVQIMTHSRCNADCLFCPYSESEHAATPGMMLDSTWHRILGNLRPWTDGINQGKMVPYLMQEPLIDKTIFDKIADIYWCFPKTCVEVSTNGAALTDKVVDKLFEQFQGRRHDIWVSHHGVDEESFRHIMAIDYHKATANLLNLLRKSNGKFTIKIRGAGEARDGKHVFFTCDQYKSFWNDKLRKEGIDTRNVSIDAFKFHDRAGTLHREDRGANTLNMGTQRQIDPQHPFHCSRVDQWVHFDWEGNMRLCCMDYHHEVKLPNINQTSLLEYFHGKEYTDLTDKISGRTGCGPEFICARCTSPGG